MSKPHISLVAVALLLASSAVAQRSSPQFSFPAPGSLATQFGADVFANSAPPPPPPSPQSQQQQPQQQQPPQQQSQAGALVPLGLSHAQLDGSQPVEQPDSARQPAPQQVSQQQQQSAQQSQQAASPLAVQQNSRPALQPLAAGSQRGQPQSAAAAAAVGSLPQASAVQPHTQSQSSTSARHHAQAHPAPAASPSQPSARASSGVSHAAAASNNNHHHSHAHSATPPAAPHQQQQQRGPNHAAAVAAAAQPAPTASVNADKQAAIDAARKAEATAASLAAASGHSYHCPDSFGYFRHHKSCDKYYACENGTATLKLCGNGLMFDDSDAKRENCAYPFSVDCGADRTDLEPPISTPHCPRLYGLFADTGNCRVFYSCWNGEASKYECPPGLAYDNEQRVCVWADLVDRCDQSEVSDGFVCPDPTEADQPGHYTRHAHPTDCRKFYVCIEGVARPYGCSFGTVFNVDSLQCDEPDNVGGCEKYYGDMDPKLAKKLARDATGASGASSSGGHHAAAASSQNTAAAATATNSGKPQQHHRDSK